MFTIYMNERLEAVVKGRVQMVMYRDFVARGARALGLMGEVKNLPDGSVRVVAEGPREKLEALVMRLKKGSLLSDVQSVECNWGSVQDAFKTFAITYD